MTRFFALLAILVFTTVMLALLTERHEGFGGRSESVTQIAGVPLVVLADGSAVERPGIVTLGGPGWGVIYLGVAGAGLVAVGAAGVGVLFGLGQLGTGLISVGQLSFGVLFSLGQLGAAIGAALGQLGIAFRSKSQAGETGDGWRFLKALNSDVGAVLRFDWKGR